jgi:hypothetical protein
MPSYMKCKCGSGNLPPEPSGGGYAIGCNVCGARGPQRKFEWMKGQDGINGRWNCRAPSPAIEKAREALRRSKDESQASGAERTATILLRGVVEALALLEVE